MKVIVILLVMGAAVFAQPAPSGGTLIDLVDGTGVMMHVEGTAGGGQSLQPAGAVPAGGGSFAMRSAGGTLLDLVDR